MLLPPRNQKAGHIRRTFPRGKEEAFVNHCRKPVRLSLPAHVLTYPTQTDRVNKQHFSVQIPTFLQYILQDVRLTLYCVSKRFNSQLGASRHQDELWAVHLGWNPWRTRNVPSLHVLYIEDTIASYLAFPPRRSQDHNAFAGRSIVQ